MIWEALGWIGTVMLMLCVFPQALATFRTGNARGMNGTFLVLWMGGSALTLVYLLALHSDAFPVIVARILNFLPLGVIVYFKIKPRKEI